MKFPFEPPQGREFDVIGFGTNAVDFLIRVPEYPDFSSKVELVEYIQAAGGEAATTMAGLQRLGLKTAYIGRFGSDPAAEFGIRSLEAEGVDTSFSECIDGAATQIAFIVIDARNGERTVIWKRDARLGFSAEDAPVDLAARARVLHLTPHDIEAAVRMAAAARRDGTIVSIDIDRVATGVEDLLPLVDILIASEEFPKQLLGISDRRAALAEMAARYGAGLCGVTLGESGSLLYCGGSYIKTPGFEVPGGCQDTTGAGDSYRVGMIYGLLTGETVEESARLANAVAALKCRAIGARTSLPDEAELRDFVEKN